MDDLISRQAAIDALADYIHNVDKVYSGGKLSPYDCRDAAHSVLDALPSADVPDRKVGEWKPFSPLNAMYSCSLCNEWVNTRSNYCPNCGAAMKGEDNAPDE